MKERRTAKFIGSNNLRIFMIKTKKTNKLTMKDAFLDRIKVHNVKTEQAISNRKKKTTKILLGGIVKKIKIKRNSKNKQNASFIIKFFLSIL
jgi:hypothetical protein